MALRSKATRLFSLSRPFSAAAEGANALFLDRISTSGRQSGAAWLASRSEEEKKAWLQAWEFHGFVRVDNLIDDKGDIEVYRDLYDDLLSGKIGASANRHDLGSNEAQKSDVENVTQITTTTKIMSAAPRRTGGK